MRPSTNRAVPVPEISVVKAGTVGWTSGSFAELYICGSTTIKDFARLVGTIFPGLNLSVFIYS